MAELPKGLLRGVIFTTEDVDATFERVRRSGAEVLQEPVDQPYGVRDCAFRDPSGNMLRFNHRRARDDRRCRVTPSPRPGRDSHTFALNPCLNHGPSVRVALEDGGGRRLHLLPGDLIEVPVVPDGHDQPRSSHRSRYFARRDHLRQPRSSASRRPRPGDHGPVRVEDSRADRVRHPQPVWPTCRTASAHAGPHGRVPGVPVRRRTRVGGGDRVVRQRRPGAAATVPGLIGSASSPAHRHHGPAGPIRVMSAASGTGAPWSARKTSGCLPRGQGQAQFSASTRRHVRGSGATPPRCVRPAGRPPTGTARPQGPCCRTGAGRPRAGGSVNPGAVPRRPGHRPARRQDPAPEGVATHHADPRQREAPAR